MSVDTLRPPPAPAVQAPHDDFDQRQADIKARFKELAEDYHQVVLRDLTRRDIFVALIEFRACATRVGLKLDDFGLTKGLYRLIKEINYAFLEGDHATMVLLFHAFLLNYEGPAPESLGSESRA